MVSGILRVAGIAVAVLGVLFLVVGPSYVISEEKFARGSAEVAPFFGNITSIIQDASFGPQKDQILSAAAGHNDGSLPDPFVTIFLAGKLFFYMPKLQSFQHSTGMLSCSGEANRQLQATFVNTISGDHSSKKDRDPLFAFGAWNFPHSYRATLAWGSHILFLAAGEYEMPSIVELALESQRILFIRLQQVQFTQTSTKFLNCGFSTCQPNSTTTQAKHVESLSNDRHMIETKSWDVAEPPASSSLGDIAEEKHAWLFLFFFLTMTFGEAKRHSKAHSTSTHTGKWPKEGWRIQQTMYELQSHGSKKPSCHAL